MFDNSAEMLQVYTAIIKIAAIPALINCNLLGKSLQHCISVVNPRCVIFDSKFTKSLDAIVDGLKSDFMVDFMMYTTTASYQADKKPWIKDLIHPAFIEKFPSTDVDPSLRKDSNCMDTLCYIFTSGTTGLPKPAKVTHAKGHAATLFPRAFRVKTLDRIYTCLPLYHSSALLIAFGSTQALGTTTILAQKFSASRFWPECIKYEATAIIYIGEIARYLINTYPTIEAAAEIRNQSKVRLAFGNGLGPDIWSRFREHFGISQIGEFYAATEATSGLVHWNRDAVRGIGACGSIGPILSVFLNAPIVKFDVVNEVPLRGPDGFCINCKNNEIGELLSEINSKIPLRRYDGYLRNDEANRKKVLRNVFCKGDEYYRTGDLFKKDDRGFHYFVDRIGETFRWKGENVSTTEVSGFISSYPGVLEAAVYGITIPGGGYDGQAGMVALVTDMNFDITDLYKYLIDRLPNYSIPRFVRVLEEEMATTGTFKHQKVKLRSENVDVSKICDEMYWLAGESFRVFGKKEYELLVAGNAKI